MKTFKEFILEISSKSSSYEVPNIPKGQQIDPPQNRLNSSTIAQMVPSKPQSPIPDYEGIFIDNTRTPASRVRDLQIQRRNQRNQNNA